jgi:3-oxoacyl-[acyl-carrier protein] reductase
MDMLKGKVALITGVAAKRGMGRGVALKFAAEGAKVVVLDKYLVAPSFSPADKDWKGLNAVVSEIQAKGGQALALTADINDSQQVEAAVAEATSKFGKIDALVHCAAIRGPMTTPLVKLTEQEWRTIIDINLTGAFVIATAVARTMIERKQGGKIVLFSSLAGNRGVAGSGAYSASKWGVLGLMKSLAIELAKDKINVNAINPGSFGTNLRDENYEQMAKAEGITTEEFRARYDKQMATRVPLGRMGVSEDIANLALFLSTDASSYITGQDVDICGGWGLIQG